MKNPWTWTLLKLKILSFLNFRISDSRMRELT
jgi:hypothetical protein